MKKNNILHIFFCAMVFTFFGSALSDVGDKYECGTYSPELPYVILALFLGVYFWGYGAAMWDRDRNED